MVTAYPRHVLRDILSEIEEVEAQITDPGEEDDPGDDDAAVSLSVKGAAAAAHVSEKTVRTWIKNGRLAATLEPGPTGPQYAIARAALDAATTAIPVRALQPSDQQALRRLVGTLEGLVNGFQGGQAIVADEVEAQTATLLALQDDLAALRALVEMRLPPPPAHRWWAPWRG